MFGWFDSRWDAIAHEWKHASARPVPDRPRASARNDWPDECDLARAHEDSCRSLLESSPSRDTDNEELFNRVSFFSSIDSTKTVHLNNDALWNELMCRYSIRILKYVYYRHSQFRLKWDINAAECLSLSHPVFSWDKQYARALCNCQMIICILWKVDRSKRWLISRWFLSSLHRALDRDCFRATCWCVLVLDSLFAWGNRIPDGTPDRLFRSSPGLRWDFGWREFESLLDVVAIAISTRQFNVARQPSAGVPE